MVEGGREGGGERSGLLFAALPRDDIFVVVVVVVSAAAAAAALLCAARIHAQAKDSHPGIQEKLKEEYETAVSSICEVKKQSKLLMHDTRLSVLIKQRLPSMDILNFIQVRDE